MAVPLEKEGVSYVVLRLVNLLPLKGIKAPLRSQAVKALARHPQDLGDEVKV